MAEEKKEKSSGSVGIMESRDPYEVIIFLVLIMGFIGFLIERFFSFRSSDLTILEAAKAYFLGILPFVIVISSTVSILFLIGIIRSVRQLTKLHHELQLKFHSVHHAGSSHAISEERVNERWKKVQKFIMSDNTSDWKLAIIEAEIGRCDA